MGPLIASVATVLIIVVFAVWVTNRDDESPRRRDFKKLKRDYVASQTALHDIEAKITATPGLDIVGQVLAADIRQIINDNRRKTLENDK